MLSPLKCFRVAALDHVIIILQYSCIIDKYGIPNSQGSVVSWFPSSNRVLNSLQYMTMQLERS